MAVWLADAAAMARGGAGARMRVGRWIRRLLITRAARSCVLCLMKVSTGYRLWVGVQRRGGDGRVCLFRGMHERALAGGGGERDAELALWGQHVIEMGQTYLGLDAGWSDRIDIWAMFGYLLAKV